MVLIDNLDGKGFSELRPIVKMYRTLGVMDSKVLFDPPNFGLNDDGYRDEFGGDKYWRFRLINPRE